MNNRIRTAILCAATLSFLITAPGQAVETKAAPKVETIQQARALYTEGKYTEAEKVYRKILDAQTSAKTVSMRDLADTLHGLGRSLLGQQEYQEAVKYLSQAISIAEAANLPKDTQSHIEADLTLASQKAGTMNSSIGPHYYYSSGDDNWMRNADPDEQEFLRKAAVGYAKQRFGLHSIAYIDRKLDYIRFLEQYHRKDDIAREASECADLFAQLPSSLQVDTASEMLETAQNLANNQLYMQADTLGNVVYRGIANGDWKSRAADIATKMTRLAQAFDRQDTSELAQKYNAAAITAFEKQTTADNPELAKMRTALAEAYKKMGKNGAAIELLELSAAAQTKNEATSGTDVVNTLSALADLYSLTGNVEKTRQTADKLITALNNSGEEGNNSFKTLMNISEFLAAKDDWVGAEKMYSSALASLKKSRNRTSEYEVQRNVKDTALKFAQLGHGDQSEKVYDALIKSRESALGLPTSQSFAAYLDKAEFFAEQEAYDRAEKAMEAGLPIAKQYPASYDQRAAELAKKLASAKHYDMAVKLLQSWLENAAGNRNIQQHTLVDAKVKLAEIYSDQGKKDEARQSLSDTAASSLSQMPAVFSTVREPLNNMLTKLIAAGKFDDAGQILQTIAQANYYTRPEDALNRLIYIRYPNDMLQDNIKIMDVVLNLVSKSSGPSSIQAANIMSRYANVLSLAGETKRAEEMQHAASVIQTLYQKQNQTQPRGNTIYKPFAPLSETLGTQEAFSIKDGLRVPR